MAWFPLRIQFALEKGTEILGSIRVQVCLVLRGPVLTSVSQVFGIDSEIDLFIPVLLAECPSLPFPLKD